MKGVFLDIDSLNRDDLRMDGLNAHFTELSFYPQTTKQDLEQRLTNAEVVMVNKVILNAAVLKRARKLKLICIVATGTNNVDLTAAAELGIVVTNIRGYANQSVVQHVFSLILSLSRNLNHYQNAIARGDWQKSELFCLLDYPITDLEGKTLGIIGYGALGRSIEKMARCLGLDVCIAQYHDDDHGMPFLPLEQLIKTSDIISLHCPLTDKTRNLIGEAELKKMKNSALLINTARGGIVNEAALAKALELGWIAGAGIDVLEVEPPDGSSPLTSETKNLILTPHIAWASRGARQNIVDQLITIIHAYGQGQIINQVNN